MPFDRDDAVVQFKLSILERSHLARTEHSEVDFRKGDFSDPLWMPSRGRCRRPDERRGDPLTCSGLYQAGC